MNDSAGLRSHSLTASSGPSLDDLIAQLESGWRAPEAAEKPEPVHPEPSPVPPPDPATVERRRAPRLKPEEFPGGIRLTIVGAADSSAVNVSQTGALAETTQRLCPGHRVDVSVRLNGIRRVLRAVVIRCAVHAVTPRPLFRAALRFTERLTEAEHNQWT